MSVLLNDSPILFFFLLLSFRSFSVIILAKSVDNEFTNVRVVDNVSKCQYIDILLYIYAIFYILLDFS